MQVQPRPNWLVGVIGFAYPHRAAVLKGRGSRAGHSLSVYAEHFNAIEVNTTFYGIPSADTVRTWADATPPGFRFSVKMLREVTHGPTPRGAPAASTSPPPGHLSREETLDTARRLIDTLAPLGAKLESVLVQFPPRFTADRREELAAFLDRLGPTAPLVVELRHHSWWTGATRALLRSRRVSWAATDEAAGREARLAPIPLQHGHPRPAVPTNERLYVRWLGRHGQFTGPAAEQFDPSSRLHWWAVRLQRILDYSPRIRTVCCFFDDDFAGCAPLTARRFMDLVGFPPWSAKSLAQSEPTLFDAVRREHGDPPVRHLSSSGPART